MIALPDPNDALLENLRAEFSGKKTIGRLLHTVIPHLEENKRSLGYMSDGGDIEAQGVLLHEKNAERNWPTSPKSCLSGTVLAQ